MEKNNIPPCNDDALLCRRCGKNNSMVTDSSTGERFCGKCGYVAQDIARSFPNNSNSATTTVNITRTGTSASLAIHDMGLATVINTANRDASGHPLSASMKSTVERLRTWDNRSKRNDPTDRNLRQALSELTALKDKLSLSPSVTEKAAYVYRKALERGLVKGRSISSLIAASLYAACRDAETPRNLKDISKAANVKRKDVARGYRLIHKELELKMPVVDPVRCVARIASQLSITEKTKRHAVRTLKKAQERKESAGKDPMGLAAAALYLSCIHNKEIKTQRSMAEAADITEVTLRSRVTGLRKNNNGN